MNESAPDVDETLAHEHLAELADDFTARYRRGERPSVDEYARKHPELADQIRDLFPALMMIEADTMGRGLNGGGDVPVAERAGQTIGRYKLLERIGEGGFGVVFLAEQQLPVRRKVALKVVKPGVDTRQVIARFEAERQALALMDHANIAKVLDAGATDSGRPYFVMELVKGVPLTEYCDTAQLPPRERLELFVHVCRAVQHAHTKGIIHRDIKPSNVLVSVQEGVAVPKVIDFGIAKATGQQLTDKTLFTNFAQMVGTPLYMSPEQAEMTGLDVDTRSDVYSLGVLLYELLTGTTPFDKERLRKAAYDEVRRIIREEEPPRPSTRISTMGDKQTTVAAHFKTDPRRLGQIVRGELDWIVMRALEKDRARRYETASGLARDVERYLHDEAVEACPPSTTYRLGKFARRHRVALLVVAIVVTSLSVLVGVLAASNRIIGAERNEKAAALVEREQALTSARENAARAEAQRQRAEDNFLKARVAVRDLLTNPARGVGIWSRMPPDLRKQFAEQGIKYYESLVREDASEPSLRYETAVGYRALALLHDDPLHQHDKAVELLRKSIDILEELTAAHPDIPEYRHQLAWSTFMLGHNVRYRNLDLVAEALAAFQRSADLYEQLIARDPEKLDYVIDSVTVFRWLGEQLARAARPQDAERAFHRAVDMHRRAKALAPDVPSNDLECFSSFMSLAGMLARQGRHRDAAESMAAMQKLFPDDHTSLYLAATLYLFAGDVEAYRRKCAELLERFASGAEVPAQTAQRTVKACSLAPDAVSDVARVERLADRVVKGTEGQGYHRIVVLAKAMCEYRAGRFGEAVRWLQRYDPKPEGPPWDGTAFATLAMARHKLGEQSEAQAALNIARAMVARKNADPETAAAQWHDWLHCEIMFAEAQQVLATP